MKKNKQKISHKLKRQAYKYHLQGLTTREIREYVPRSHAWIALAIQELSTGSEKTLDKK